MANANVQPDATITCPSCGDRFVETMPTDACRFFWECPACGDVARAEQGHCCVYCSYADVPCPPIQLDSSGDEAQRCCPG